MPKIELRARGIDVLPSPRARHRLVGGGVREETIHFLEELSGL